MAKKHAHRASRVTHRIPVSTPPSRPESGQRGHLADELYFRILRGLTEQHPLRAVLEELVEVRAEVGPLSGDAAGRIDRSEQSGDGLGWDAVGLGDRRKRELIVREGAVGALGDAQVEFPAACEWPIAPNKRNGRSRPRLATSLRTPSGKPNCIVPSRFAPASIRRSVTIVSPAANPPSE